MTIPITDLHLFKKQALQWAASFDVFCVLDSNGFKDKYSRFDALIAIGAKADVTATAGAAFSALEEFRANNPGWVTGFFGYDLKNETENLSSANTDQLQFPDLYFFVPQYLLVITDGQVEIIADDPAFVLNSIQSQHVKGVIEQTPVNIRAGFTRAAYLDAVENIRERIRRGDIYVTNFCQEFFAEETSIDPISTFLKLVESSPAPFSVLFKWKYNYIISATPERFLARRGDKLISQPIKGTIERGKTAAADRLNKDKLRKTSKELQENVMIVDLVRNDLTRSAKPGTVKTEELFGIYSFRQVHQMISTVTCDIDESLSSVQVIKNSFPMGSMTGAPKVSSMRLMEQFELSRRGIYSGSVGYFSPDGDFDFNVVIRTILYNSHNRYLSFHAGSAITWYANAASEYNECLLKVKAIMEILQPH